MGLFSSKVPDTIGDKRMADLRRRAQKADKESMFSKRNVRRRLASNEQMRKSRWS